jgi:polysaccharide pyruvyl transferase CsaB
MRAVLCGYYGMGNGGDEALLATLLQMLPNGVTPLVLSGNPTETTQRYGVEAIPRKSLQAVWRALGRSQAFIWGGGSLMQDASSRVNPLYYGGLMKLAQWRGLTTIAWAQGIGPLNYATSRWLTRWALQGCASISVRDQGSAQWLTHWQLSGRVAPDPVWALEPESLPEAAWTVPPPRVAVALRPHPNLTPARLDRLAQALADFQVATQTNIVLIPFQSSKDLEIANLLAQALSGPHQILQVTQPAQLKGLFRAVTMTLGMRFHALVMAVAEGCPSFGISYDPKVTQLMTDLSLPGWSLVATADLPPIPQTAHEITQTWVDQYHQGNTISSQRSLALTRHALNHQTLLRNTLTPDLPT